MKEFIITSDQMKMLAESVGYFVDEPIGEVVIGGETLPDADELRAENAKLRELADSSYTFAFNCYHGVFDQAAFFRLREKYRDSGIEVPA